MGNGRNTLRLERRVSSEDAKERNLEKCENCSRILLLTGPEKILSWIILGRFRNAIGIQLKDEQKDFCSPDLHIANNI